MRLYSRLLTLSLLVSCCLTADVVAQEAVSSGNWSDSSTWAGDAVPQAGRKGAIGTGADVVLDTSPPALNGLTIKGKLSFSDDADLELSTEWILVFGEPEIGTETRPHISKATITLIDNVKDEQLMGMGDAYILIHDGETTASPRMKKPVN